MTSHIKKRLTLPLICLLILIGLVAAGFFFKDRLTTRPIEIKEVKIDTKAALKLNILKQISQKNGIKEWELTAASATLLRDQNKAVLVDVFVKFFTKESNEVHLKSETGTLDTKIHNMTFSDQVVVTYEGAVLTTDKLHYNKKEHIIYADSRIRLEKQDSVIEGDSMTTDLNTGTITFNGNVKGQFSENFMLN